MNLAKKIKFKQNVRTDEDDFSLMGDLYDMGSGDITNKIKEN